MAWEYVQNVLCRATFAGVTHLSDSAVQRAAEVKIVQQLATELGVALLPGGRIQIGGGGAYVQVDARSAHDDVIVEAYARQGALKGAQLKKVGQDILKFALLRRTAGWVDARLILAFASAEAKESIRGWVAQAAEVFEVEFVVVDLPPEDREQILAAQQRQVMVNLSADEADALADQG
ncbi:MAG: hypothetical protein ACRDJB_01955 [Actinomycetota bacterium]